MYQAVARRLFKSLISFKYISKFRMDFNLNYIGDTLNECMNTKLNYTWTSINSCITQECETKV